MTPGQIAGTTIVVAGFVMAIVGLVLAVAVDPLVGVVLFLVGVSDIVVGLMFRSGRLGGGQDARAGQSPDANPYARED